MKHRTNIKESPLKLLNSLMPSLLVYSVLLSICLIFLNRNLIAQEQDLKFKNITIENGLSHSKVNCIYQDSRGFLWFGTNEGLNKFDGYNFTVFQQDPDNPNSISANLIRCIFEDRQGNLWIGTESGGLNLFDRNSNTFSHLSTDSSSHMKISGENVNSILEDSRGNFWIGTNQGIDLVNWKEKRIVNFLPYQTPETPKLFNEVLVIFEDSQNALWVGTTGGGLCLFDRGQKEFTCFTHDKKNPHSLSDNEIRSIYEDHLGNLWIGTTYGGLNLFDKKNSRFSHFYPGRNNPESTTIRAILEDNQGSFWVGNRSGLYKLDRYTNQFSIYTHDSNNPYSLIQNSIQTIFKDAKGDLWIGTRGGISYLNTTNIPFIHYRADANNRRCLNKQAVYALLEDHAGNIWFGTEHGGLNFLNRKTGLFTYYKYSINNPNSLSVNNVKALIEDRDGNLWIGTYNGGLNFFLRSENRFIHYRHNAKDRNSLSNDNVMTLLMDESGDIWIGTYDGGLDRFNLKTRQFVHELSAWHELGFHNIHCLIKGQNDKLWIGASQSKIGCIDLKTNHFSYYQLNHNMKNVDVMAGYEDKKGNLWFGTVGAGLYSFDRKNESFKEFTKKDGLPSNVIFGILEDQSGNLWFSTTNGLCQFNPVTLKVKNYYKENGLQSDQFNYNACLKTRDQQMFFGGINGVTAFFPDRIQQNDYAPPVVISDFQILNKRVPIDGKNPILAQDISETKTIRLSYKHSVFSFEFVALNYAISEQNQYAYKMEGFDTDWNFVGPRRFASYTNLNPGTYTFRVKAANNDGVWNEKGASIKITITPPIWKTIWFKFIIAGLFLLMIWHFYLYLRQKRNLLKAKALANLAQFKLLRNQMNPHFLFNALGSIRSMILISVCPFIIQFMNYQ